MFKLFAFSFFYLINIQFNQIRLIITCGPIITESSDQNLDSTTEDSDHSNSDCKRNVNTLVYYVTNSINKRINIPVLDRFQ